MGVKFSFAITALLLLPAHLFAAERGATCTNPALQRLAQRTIEADYRADLAGLERVQGELATLKTDESCEPRVAYWRAFAGWRYATNASNKETATKQEIAGTLERSAGVLRMALTRHPDDLEAKIALLGIVQMAPIFLEPGSSEQRNLMKEALDLNGQLAIFAYRNPRYLWLRGGTHFWAPAPFGEGTDAALASYFRGIAFANAQPPSKDVIEPAWGLPELLMSVAYVNAHREKPDFAVASQFATAALRLRPDWSYVRDILVPDIANRSAIAPR